MTMSMSTDHNLISHDTQIIELANDINNLINEVADKVKKGLVEIEEKVLLNFKDAFV